MLLRVNDQQRCRGIDVADALADEPPGSKIALMVARDNAPVELTASTSRRSSRRRRRPLFARGSASGRVDLTRAGNLVTATTRGVAAFTLLLSPDQFDFAQAGEGRRQRPDGVRREDREERADAAEVRRVDNDRTMLFGAELHVDLD